MGIWAWKKIDILKGINFTKSNQDEELQENKKKNQIDDSKKILEEIQKINDKISKLKKSKE